MVEIGPIFCGAREHESMDGGFKDYFMALDQDRIDFLKEFMGKVELFIKRAMK